MAALTTLAEATEKISVVENLFDLPTEQLEAVLEHVATSLDASTFARFARVSRSCAAAAVAVQPVVIPARIAQRIRARRHAGELACTKCPILDLPPGISAINEDAFRDCSRLTSITLPTGVNAIHRAAFADCTALTEISLPATVAFLGSHAFNGCTASPPSLCQRVSIASTTTRLQPVPLSPPSSCLQA